MQSIHTHPRRASWLAGVGLSTVIASASAHAQPAPAAPDTTTPAPSKPSKSQPVRSTPAPPVRLTQNQASATGEEVTVTARKRSELLQDVPISISAFTAKTIRQRGIYSIANLADQTPGLTVDSDVGGSGRNDRSFPEYVIRGMVPSLQTNPTTTVFLDGAPLISGQIASLDDLERVEVLKGPQSAYFGRETFAGAISLVTKDPSNTPRATVDALVGSPNNYDERLTAEGPIIPDILTIRGSYRFYSRQGSYDNEAVADKTSQHLGDQSTQSGNVEIVAKPVENLKIKILGMYWHDNDGPSAQALIEPSQSNCLGFWFCGVVPKPLPTQPASNDVVTAQTGALLRYLATPAGQQPFKPLSDQYGLTRDAYHGSINIDYYLPSIGVTATSLTAIDNQRYSELQDLANDDASAIPNLLYSKGLPYANPYFDYPFYVENEYRNLSQEFRLTSDAGKRFRWLLGVNYEWSRVDEGFGGGDGYDYFVGHAPEVSSIYSGFYGLSYDIFKSLTLNFEGRFQADTESTSPEGAHYQATYKDFLPRVTLQYRFAPQMMAYATYSQGVNPGSFNGFIPGLPAAEQTVLAKDYGATVAVRPEHLVNYELGAKGTFLGGRLTANADVYYDIWTNQINVTNVQYFSGPVLETTTADLNDGKSDLPGVEGDLNLQIVRGLFLNASGAINDTKIRAGGCYTCLERIGTTDVNGNQLPNVSKVQATVGLQYDTRLSRLTFGYLPGLSTWGAFGRADYIYKSGNYQDKDNLVRTPDENMLNLRAGVTRGPLRIEAFVENATNWSGPTSLSSIVNLGNPKETYVHTNDALVAGLPYLRTYGLRLRYVFE